VLGLSAYHVWLAGYHPPCWRGERKRAVGKALRMLNEIPGIAAALIVMLVILQAVLTWAGKQGSTARSSVTR
jgi:putative membrane protein